MSDSNHEPNQLETLQQMLEAEMRGNPEPPKAPKEPAPAVAKPDDLGSLLGDLLSEAEKEVGRERPDDSVDAKPQAARPASDRLPTRDM